MVKGNCSIYPCDDLLFTNLNTHEKMNGMTIHEQKFFQTEVLYT